MDNNYKNLGMRSIRGGMWVFTAQVIGKGFGIVRLIVLARLLAPEDFGLMGIAMLAISTLETFSKTGIETALIQRKDNIKPFLAPAWTFLVIRGLIIFSLLFFSAPLVAIFFNSPSVVSIIRFLGFYALIKAFSNIGVIYFEKELEFKKQFIFQISGTLVDMIVSIVLSILLRNVWALVFGLLAGQMTMLCASYIMHPLRPTFSFNLKQVRELFSFGKWILGSSILGFIINQGDDIVVGKMLNPINLGFYQMAYRLSNLPATEITQVISRVTFSAYSKIQDNVSRLRNAVTRTLRLVSFVSVPLGGGMFILAAEMTRVFLGEKWLPIVPAFELLCIIGVVRSITANFGSILNSQGRPDIQTRASLLNTLILALSLYHLVKYFGMMGAVYSRLVTLLSQFYIWPYVLRTLQMSLKEMLKTFSLPFISTLLMVFSIAVAKNLFYRVNLLNLLSLVGVGLLVYFPVLFLLDKIFNHGIMKELKIILNEFKRQ